MASEHGFKHFRYEEQHAFLKWKRTFIRARKQQLSEKLSDVDMPAWKKRRLIREVVYYAGTSDYQPMRALDVYDYKPEDDLRMSDAASFGFAKSDVTGSSSAASSSAEYSTIGTAESVDASASSSSSGLAESPPAASLVNEAAREFTAAKSSGLTDTSVAESAVEEVEEVDEASTSRGSRLVDSSPNENEFETMEQLTTSNPGTPEQSRRLKDCNMEILSLSPALSALKINHNTAKESEAEEFIEDFVNHSNVRFIKLGKLCTLQSKRLPFTTIYKGGLSTDFTTVKAADEPEVNTSTMLLVPSNVQRKVQELALQFADDFGYRVMGCDASEGSLDKRVSHVLVDLEVPEPLQFVQCQAIGCRRYLVSTDWLRDSLKAGRVLSEEPFELIFWNENTGASVAAPSRIARLCPQYLFDGFAILMCRPFDSFKESEMKQLLIMNGARICEHPRELAKSSNQARVCIVDPKFYRKGQMRKLLKLKSEKYKFVAVDCEWLFHSFIMYQVRPLLRYLHDAEPEEALQAGVLEEFLKD